MKRIQKLNEDLLNQLKSLECSGAENSLESLAASAFSEITGSPFRVARSGSQFGIDAKGEIPIAIQSKRYGSKPPGLVQLQGELSTACREYPDLQAFVFVMTCRLGADNADRLVQYGLDDGIGALIIDDDSAPQLEHWSGVCALAALAPSEARRCVQSVGGDLKSLEKALKALRSSPGFSDWRSALKEQLLSTPSITRFLASRLNERLAKRIEVSSLPQVEFDSSRAVERSASERVGQWLNEAQSSQWLDEAQSSVEPSVLVIEGERYDGKSWACLDWLRRNGTTLQIPTFFVPSAIGKQGADAVQRTIVSDIVEVAPRLTEEQASKVLQRIRGRASSSPWSVIVVDGWDEYLEDQSTALEIVHWAIGNSNPGHVFPAAVVVTARIGSWRDAIIGLRYFPEPEGESLESEGDSRPPRSSRPVKHQRICVGEFDDQEFSSACELYKVDVQGLAAIPERALQMMTRPRYLALVAKHCTELGQYSEVTPALIFYLDTTDKARFGALKKELETAEGSLERVLQKLARDYLAKKKTRQLKFFDENSAAIKQIGRLMSALESEGLVSVQAGTIEIEDEDRLLLAIGLVLIEELEDLAPNLALRTEKAKDILSPLRQTDEATFSLRVAVVQALQRASPTTVQALASLWISQRHFQKEDLETIEAIRASLGEHLFEIAPLLLDSDSDYTNREVLKMVFQGTLERDPDRAATFLRSWVRSVPGEGSERWRKHQAPREELEPAEEIARKIALANSQGLSLEAVDYDCEDLHRIALFLAHCRPAMLSSDDLLNLIAAMQVSGWPYFDDAICFILRDLIEHVPRAWFESKAGMVQESEGSPGKAALHRLAAISRRADLEELADRLVEPRDARDLPRSTLGAEEFSQIAAATPHEGEDLVSFAVSSREIAVEAEDFSMNAERATALSREADKIFETGHLFGNSQVTSEWRTFSQALPTLARWVPAAAIKIIEREALKGIAALQEAPPDSDLIPSVPRELRRHIALVRGRVRDSLRTLLVKSPNLDLRETDVVVGFTKSLLLPGGTVPGGVSALLSWQSDFELRNPYSLLSQISTSDWYLELLDRLLERPSASVLWRIHYALLRSPPVEVDQEKRKEVRAMLATVEPVGLRVALSYSTRLGTDLPPDLLAEPRSPKDPVNSPARLLAERLSYEELSSTDTDEFGIAVLACREPGSARAYLLRVDSQLDAINAERPSGGAQSPTGMPWFRELFPAELLNHLDLELGEKWIGILSRDPEMAYKAWTGLTYGLVEWAARRGSRCLQAVFKLVYPFQRDRFSGLRSRINYRGVDQALHGLLAPSADSTVVEPVVRDLLMDARNDQELFDIALAARFGSTTILRNVANDLLSEESWRLRAVAARVMGWLCFESELARLAKADPSLYVREVAQLSLEESRREARSRHWFARFCEASTTIERWRASQLFFETADERTWSWVWSEADQRGLTKRQRGELYLLLEHLDDDLKRRDPHYKKKSKYLWMDVNNLERLVSPWFRDDEWLFRLSRR